MQKVAWAIAMQGKDSFSRTSNSPIAEYLAIAILAVLLGWVVLIFIRTGVRRPSKR